MIASCQGQKVSLLCTSRTDFGDYSSIIMFTIDLHKSALNLEH